MFGEFKNDSPAPAESAAPATEVAQEAPVESGETTVAVESESATDTNAEGVTETTAASTDEAGEDVGEGENERKPKRGFERRIEKFNQKLSAKEAEIEYWKKVALGQAPEQQSASQPQGKPKFSDYNDIEAYTDALTDWKLNGALSQVQQQTQFATVASTYEQRLSQFKQTTPDFDEVMSEFVADYGDLNIPEVLEVAMESDVGPNMAYYIAKNPEVIDTLAKLPPRRRYIELGKLEEKVRAPKQTAPAPETKKISAAPAPVKPVKGTGKVESLDLSDPNLSYADWLKRRQATLKRK